MIELPKSNFPQEASLNPPLRPKIDYHPSLERADNIARIFGSAKLPSEFRQQDNTHHGVKYTKTSAAIEREELRIAMQAGSSVSLIVSSKGLNQVEFCLSGSDGSITGMRRFDMNGKSLDWSPSSEIGAAQVKLADSYLDYLLPQIPQTAGSRLVKFFGSMAKRVAQLIS